jgi:hypothetical protein
LVGRAVVILEDEATGQEGPVRRMGVKATPGPTRHAARAAFGKAPFGSVPLVSMADWRIIGSVKIT